MDDRLNWYDVLFSINAGALTDQEKTDLANLNANWVLLNRRNARFYVNIIGPKSQLLAIQNYLVNDGRNPITIGVFQYNPDTDTMDLVGTPNKAEYLNVAPDVVTYTYDALGNILSTVTSRPTSFIDVHRFAGYPPKNVP